MWRSKKRLRTTLVISTWIAAESGRFRPTVTECDPTGEYDAGEGQSENKFSHVPSLVTRPALAHGGAEEYRDDLPPGSGVFRLRVARPHTLTIGIQSVILTDPVVCGAAMQM